MRRAKPEEADDAPGADSFLDIVANMVGIVVLLVVVVGVRAGRDVMQPAAVAEPSRDLAPLRAKIEQTTRTAIADRQEAVELRDKALAAEQEVQRREIERQAATLYVTKLRAELDDARNGLSTGDRRSLDTSNAIAQVQLRLDRLAREQIALGSVEPAPDVKTVTVAPTPIVDGRADETVSFRLKGGRLVYVPVNELEVELARKASVPGFPDPTKTVVTREKLGPVDGFEGEAEIAWSVRSAGGRVGVAPRLGKLVLREVTPLRGEDPDDAFRPGGYVASRIDLLDPKDFVVRLIVYADSFATASDVGTKFRERGFRVAQSLKNDGSPIGFSSDGYKAVTQ